MGNLGKSRIRKTDEPALDGNLSARSAVARNGQPLTYNRAPAPDLAPWIARLYVGSVALPPDHMLSCGLFGETCVLRIQLDGDWVAHGIRGPLARNRCVKLFGPQSRRMPVTVTGGFTSLGVLFRAGALRMLGGPTEQEVVDAIVLPTQLGIDASAWLDMINPHDSAEVWCQQLEQALRHLIATRATGMPDPVSSWFERVSYADPSIQVAQCAEDGGIDTRRLERIVRRDFGMTPKHVMRRARALDMASHLRGVADQGEAEALMLRYYDQSHLIREFTALIGMSPRQFVERPQPLMVLTLATRQARRLEMLKRIAPGESPPWLDRAFVAMPTG